MLNSGVTITRENYGNNFLIFYCLIDCTDDPKCKIYFDQMQIIHLIARNAIFKNIFFFFKCALNIKYIKRDWIV